MINQIKKGPIPQHVAIIMDGNGRWAKAQGLKRSAGHKEGVETIRKIAIAANAIGVKVLTLYAFSTENWQRPLAEVKYLMQLPEVFFKTFLPELLHHNIQVKMTGFEDKVPKMTQKVINQAIKKTAKCTGMVLNFAFNYGGRAEIVSAVQKLAEQVATGKLTPAAIDEPMIQQQLLTADLAPYDDVDFLIRTSGEERLSNFLLWQNAYSEFYFTEIYWPDFDQAAFYEAIKVYQQRNRRFGQVNHQEGE